jgi:hypothetical protein
MNDIQILKKFYGEKFAHLCRSTFPLILENETLLPKLIMDNFAPSKVLYEDLAADNQCYIRFKDFIFEKYHEYEKYQEIPQENLDMTAEELMAKAGYTLYPECKQFKDMLQFKKYFAPNELLCSFEPLNERLKKCRVWFAVKEGAEKLNRKDFAHPEREDKYGTSVISIQFTKDLFSTLSIKNRYNHSVQYPDSTFHNNLDEIIPGLAQAFYQEYEIKPSSSKYSIILNLPNYEKANDGKYYKVINKLNKQHLICENNYVLVNGEAYHFDPDRYLLLNNGDLIDTKEKKITPAFIPTSNKEKNKAVEEYNDSLKTSSFAQSFEEITKIDISKNNYGGKKVVITPKKEENRDGQPVELNTDCSNKVIEIYDPLKISPAYYLTSSNSLKKANFPNLKEAGVGFLQHCIRLEQFTADNLEKIGHHCLSRSYEMKDVSLPKLKTMGDGSFQETKMNTFYAPELEEIGQYCLCGKIKNFIANKLKKVDRASMSGKIENLEINSIDCLPELLYHDVRHISAKNATAFDCKCVGHWGFYAKNLASANVLDPELQDFFDKIISRNQDAKLKQIEEKYQSMQK